MDNINDDQVKNVHAFSRTNSEITEIHCLLTISNTNCSELTND